MKYLMLPVWVYVRIKRAIDLPVLTFWLSYLALFGGFVYWWIA